MKDELHEQSVDGRQRRRRQQPLRARAEAEFRHQVRQPRQEALLLRRRRRSRRGSPPLLRRDEHGYGRIRRFRRRRCEEGADGRFSPASYVLELLGAELIVGRGRIVNSQSQPSALAEFERVGWRLGGAEPLKRVGSADRASGSGFWVDLVRVVLEIGDIERWRTQL